MKLFVLLALFSSLCPLNSADDASVELTARDSKEPMVKTTHGWVSGFSALNNTVDVFYGIPFARSPTGELRFEMPRSPEKWNTVLNATARKSSCYPHTTASAGGGLTITGQSSGNYSEDCLYLNIFTPHGKNGKYASKLPVMLAIHGGGFQMGSSARFDNVTDVGTNFVQHGIVLVSIQYRVGELGFASTGDKVMPGNLGLWDQVQALKFVKANIARFGGDPDQITLKGQSAGSGSVSSLVLSPASRDLFKRAIQMSGSAVSSWVYGSRVVNDTTRLVTTLNCSRTNSTSIKRCLKQKTVEEIMTAVSQMGSARAEPNTALFVPRFDGIFFPEDPVKLIKRAPKKPTLISFTQLESLIFTFWGGQNSSLSYQTLPWSAIETWGPEQLRNYIKTEIAYPERFGAVQQQAANEIFKFYTNATLGIRANYSGSAFYIRQYAQVISDILFIMSSIWEIQRKAAQGWPLYMYINSYYDDVAFPSQNNIIHESWHGSDEQLVFYDPSMKYTFNAQDRKIQAFFLEAFRNFVKSGNPSTTSDSIPLKWPPIRDPSRLRHVQVQSPKPIVRADVDEELRARMAFWDRMTAKYPQYNLIREIPQQQK